MKTMTSGAINPANFGTNFNFAFNPVKSREGNTQSGPQSFDSIVEILRAFSCLSTRFGGERSKNQNANA